MRPVSHYGRAVTYSKVGLMVLAEQFEQRTVDTTMSSFSSRIPLTTPSGPQWTESELEAELVEQIAFSPGVYDIITQPIIRYPGPDGKERRYTPDIAVQLYAAGDDPSTRYIIEVKRSADIEANREKYATKFQAAQTAAEQMGASFRILTENEIRTPFLKNTRLLGHHLKISLSDDEVEQALRLGESQPKTIAEAIKFLAGRIGELDAREAVEKLVVYRMIHCDLSLPFSDQLPIAFRKMHAMAAPREDPILRLIRDSSSN